jgi:thymidine kinase
MCKRAIFSYVFYALILSFTATQLSTKELAAGSLEVVCGSMYAGKSEALIRLMKRAEYAKKIVHIFKPSIDTRTSVDKVHSHNGNNLPATPIDTKKPEDILLFPDLGSIDVVGIDEAQFFHPTIVDVVDKLIAMGKQVIVVGLDLDFKQKPFGAMPILLAKGDKITKLNAVCLICGKDAYVSQRLVNGKPAKEDDPLILIGAKEAYEARCRTCYALAPANSPHK